MKKNVLLNNYITWKGAFWAFIVFYFSLSAVSAAPITIKSVTYGGVSSYAGKDFKTALQNFIKNANRVKIGEFNAIFGDPTLGVTKTVITTFCGVDGVDKTTSASEGSFLILDSGAAAPAVSPISLVSVTYYGAASFGSVNYMQVLKNMIGLNDICVVTVDELARFAQWQDPAVGVLKTLVVKYNGLDGVVKTISADDRGYLVLDGTSVAVATTNPTAPVGAVAKGNWFLDTAGYIWFNKGTSASPNWTLASDASGDTQFFTQIVDTYLGNFYALSKTQKDAYGNYACYYREGVSASNLMGTKWTFSNGNLAKIVLAGSYLWGVNTAGIYYLSFASGKAVWVRVEGPSGVSINPTVIDVITHSVAVTDSTGKVWIRVGDGIGTSWVQGNWRLDESGYIWFNKGTAASPNWTLASDASGDTQFFTQIVDTYMGNFYALSKTQKDAYGNYACYYREGVSASNLMGAKWTFTNGNFGKIVLAGYYLWGVNTAGIYYLSFVSGKAVWVKVEGPSGVSINPKVIDVIGSSVAVTDSTGKVWVRTGDGIGTSWLSIGETTPTTDPNLAIYNTVAAVTKAQMLSDSTLDLTAFLAKIAQLKSSTTYTSNATVLQQEKLALAAQIIRTFRTALNGLAVTDISGLTAKLTDQSILAASIALR